MRNLVLNFQGFLLINKNDIHKSNKIILDNLKNLCLPKLHKKSQNIWKIISFIFSQMLILLFYKNFKLL